MVLFCFLDLSILYNASTRRISDDSKQSRVSRKSAHSCSFAIEFCSPCFDTKRSELAVATRRTIVWPIEYEHHWVKRGISRGGELLQFMCIQRSVEWILVDFFVTRWLDCQVRDNWILLWVWQRRTNCLLSWHYYKGFEYVSSQHATEWRGKHSHCLLYSRSSILNTLTTLILLFGCVAFIILPNSLVDKQSGAPSIESCFLFGFLVCSVYILFYNFISDLNNPFQGVSIKWDEVAQHVICWKQSGWLQSNHPLLRGEVLDFEQVEERGISHLPISCWCKVQAWAI